MRLKKVGIGFLWILTGLLLSPDLYASETNSVKRIKVSLRKIGHEVLMKTGDSTSRILPIQKINNRYKIAFDTIFKLHPEELVSIVDQQVKSTHLSSHYIIEVQGCRTIEVVYSYESAGSISDENIHCKGRDYPRSCYEIWITFFDPEHSSLIPKAPGSSNTAVFWILGVLCCIFIAGLVMYRRKRRNNHPWINIGEFQFNRETMQLLWGNKDIELTYKEAELLYLLYCSANTTITREELLKLVWGDEGHYVGRTLDVFISKLRKKLSVDSNLKITNVRGVGYRLVMSK